MSEVIRHTPIENPDYREYAKRFRDRQEQVGGNEYSNVVEFSFMAHPLLNLISDWHIGHPTTDYRRIEDEVNEITNTINSYVVLLGDEIDNLHWNPGQMEQMEQTPEQIGFFLAIMRHLAEQEKLLLRVSGDHDGWLAKAGFDMGSLVRSEGVNTSNGPTHMVNNVPGGRYLGFMAHRLPGHSMYNRNHPQMRAERFGSGRGADFIASGHNHQKQLASGFTHEELGVSRPIDYIALGSYKPTDGWLQKKGYSPQQRTPEQMFGVSLFLGPNGITTSPDIVEANLSFQKMREHGGFNRLTPLERTGYLDPDMVDKWTDWDNYPDEAARED